MQGAALATQPRCCCDFLLKNAARAMRSRYFRQIHRCRIRKCHVQIPDAIYSGRIDGGINKSVAHVSQQSLNNCTRETPSSRRLFLICSSNFSQSLCMKASPIDRPSTPNILMTARLPCGTVVNVANVSLVLPHLHATSTSSSECLESMVSLKSIP